MSRSMYLAAIAALACAVGSAAASDGVTSTYTSTADKDCRKLSSFKIDGDDYASEYLCPGYAGLKVLKQEDDLREKISVGRSAGAAAREPAAAQGFGPFNSTTNSVEWRVANGRPFAMIQRWHIADNDDPDKTGRPQAKQMLVVTRLPPGAVCHVAYIDVTANADANEIARKAADEVARGFGCSTAKAGIAGVRGRTADFAASR
ncbi:MAG: hypothetical protein JWR89_892 [Tardiphaga sp.]|uniref:hypothetical protein n=1 Tax=Tardiphaga sp. TaxID=1926292 RepID=UPI002610C03B|nr:hypothetical protein [Tardiphaga sp.]MDB5500990.1 hypothetical protein [Tardiphaga sp.]